MNSLKPSSIQISSIIPPGTSRHPNNLTVGASSHKRFSKGQCRYRAHFQHTEALVQIPTTVGGDDFGLFEKNVGIKVFLAGWGWRLNVYVDVCLSSLPHLHNETSSDSHRQNYDCQHRNHPWFLLLIIYESATPSASVTPFRTTSILRTVFEQRITNLFSYVLPVCY